MNKIVYSTQKISKLEAGVETGLTFNGQIVDIDVAIRGGVCSKEVTWRGNDIRPEFLDGVKVGYSGGAAFITAENDSFDVFVTAKLRR